MTKRKPHLDAAQVKAAVPVLSFYRAEICNFPPCPRQSGNMAGRPQAGVGIGLATVGAQMYGISG